jgi:Tol biopolymer transport system component
LNDFQSYLSVRQLLGQHRIALSPDGEYVAFVVKDPNRVDASPPEGTSYFFNGCQLWIRHIAAGTVFMPISESGRSWCPGWNADSSKLAFYADHGGQVRLYVWDTATRQTKPLSSAVARGYSFPMDRPKWLDLHTVCIPLSPGIEGSDDGSPGTSPAKEGSSARSDCTAYELYWRSNKKKRQAENVDTGASPEEDLYFKHRADVGIIDIHTGAVRRVVTNRPVRLPFPSPDGKHIAFSTVGQIRFHDPIQPALQRNFT